jgi:hypothetical protein
LLRHAHSFLSLRARHGRHLVEHEMGDLALALRPAKREVAFGAKHIAIEIRYPLPTA